MKESVGAWQADAAAPPHTRLPYQLCIAHDRERTYLCIIIDIDQVVDGVRRVPAICEFVRRKAIDAGGKEILQEGAFLFRFDRVKGGLFAKWHEGSVGG